jgi:hypothetical protein
VEVVIVFGTRQDGATEQSACCVNLGLAPPPDIVLFQQCQRFALISLEKIFRHSLLYLTSGISETSFLATIAI